MKIESEALDGGCELYRPAFGEEPPVEEAGPPLVLIVPLATLRMPFGKYRNRQASNVPAHYADWLLRQDWFEPKHPELAAYFRWALLSIQEHEARKWERL